MQRVCTSHIERQNWACGLHPCRPLNSSGRTEAAIWRQRFTILENSPKKFPLELGCQSPTMNNARGVCGGNARCREKSQRCW
jgi:hypothetical protein